MWLITAGVGSASGVAAAFALRRLFGRLRQSERTAADVVAVVAVVGWGLALLTILLLILLSIAAAAVTFDIGPQPPPGPLPMGSLFGFGALVLGELLLVCSGLGLIHRRKTAITWTHAFGVLMAEAGAAVGLALVLNQVRDSIFDMDHATLLGIDLVGCFHLSLLVALLLLETIVPWRTAES